MTFRLLLLKRLVEDVLMFPLILVGRFIASRKPLGKEYTVFFFFPFYHTGGAEKVHALVAKASGDQNCIIFFTRKSHNAAFLQKFKESSCDIRDISKYTDNKVLYFVNIIFRGIVSAYINRQRKAPVVFNGQCNFGYKISPWIKREIRQVELIHSVSNFSYIRIPFLPFISRTVMISEEKIKEHLRLYEQFGIPNKYAVKIVYIPNASEFEKIDLFEKKYSPFVVLYSGRATAEKRAHLFANIAEKVYAKEASIQFVMAGDDFAALDKKRFGFIHFKGHISDEQELAALYKKSSVVCIASSTEGFPLAVIEGMAYGCAILATGVGDIPLHVKTGENGFVFSSVEEESKIVEEGCDFILRLKNDSALLQRIAANNVRYAQEMFSYDRFAADYRKLIYS